MCLFLDVPPPATLLVVLHTPKSLGSCSMTRDLHILLQLFNVNDLRVVVWIHVHRLAYVCILLTRQIRVLITYM